MSVSLGACLSQNTLFRNQALVSRTESNTPLLGGGSVSHHSKTVSDGTSTVHRHHTQATNPGVQVLHNTPSLFNNPIVAARQSSLQSSPSLLQHTDGRFFALNANLNPGQLFQTADGRTFTLVNTANSFVDARSTVSGFNNGQLHQTFNVDNVQSVAGLNNGQVFHTGGRAFTLDNGAGGLVDARSVAGLNNGQLIHNGGRTFTLDNGAQGVGSLFNGQQFLSGGRTFGISNADPTFQNINNFRSVASPFTGALQSQVRTATGLSPAVVGQGNYQLADSRTPVFQGFFSNPVSGVNYNF